MSSSVFFCGVVAAVVPDRDMCKVMFKTSIVGAECLFLSYDIILY